MEITVQQKYHQLIMAAQAAGVKNIFIREFNNILYIDGEAPSTEVQQQLWQLCEQIDPGYASGDLVMSLQVSNNNIGNAAA